ncbi:MAG: apolipoprotein N-acyltransferase [Clostridia bacterium]|nr:apolipoprotein N-acyltransferase [Clostridia bacterium]
MRLFSVKKFRVSLLVGSALLTALTLMLPQYIGLLEWVSLVPFALVTFSFAERGTPLKKHFLYLLLFFGVYYFAIFHFFVTMYPMEFLGISKLAALGVVAVAWLGLTALQAIPFALAFLALRPLGRCRAVRRCRLLFPFLAAAIWTVLEWLLTLTWAGVPWSRLALGQVKLLPLLQSASLFGSYFVTFLIVAVNFLLAYVLYYEKKKLLLVPILMFSVNLLVGGTLMLAHRDVGEAVQVAAVQGNVSSQEKWDTSRYLDNLKLQKRLTTQAVKRGADIVVWAESSFPDVLDDIPSVEEFLSGTASGGDCYLLAGAFDTDEEGNRYNSMFTFRPDGSRDDTVYNKRHLVPFGEFVPLRPLVEFFVPALADINAANEDFTAGQDSNVVTTEYGKLGISICFDSIYEETVRDSVRDGAELLVIATNDSWFLHSAALGMHNSQSVLRAVENGRWLVRAANTGISSIISPTGETVAQIGANKEWYICEEVYMCEELTLYSRIGNLFVLLCGIFIAFVPTYELIGHWQKKRRTTN